MKRMTGKWYLLFVYLLWFWIQLTVESSSIQLVQRVLSDQNGGVFSANQAQGQNQLYFDYLAFATSYNFLAAGASQMFPRARRQLRLFLSN